MPSPPQVVSTPRQPAVAPKPAVSAPVKVLVPEHASIAPQTAVHVSMPPAFKVIGEDATGLVHVSIAPPEPPLPGADRDSPIPTDFAFSADTRKRRITAIAVTVMLLGVGGLVAAMIFSYMPR
jgi:hypothetical protein